VAELALPEEEELAHLLVVNLVMVKPLVNYLDLVKSTVLKLELEKQPALVKLI
jgi:delta-aminolevulinic acid dehydratase/porphobilinogen synthase